MSVLSNRLRKLRTINKKKQKDVADYLGVSESAYGFYEQDKREPSNVTLDRLAKYFNTTTDYLLGRTDNPNLPSETKPKEVLKVADEIFFDGYLEASEEEKEQLRRYWYEQVKKMKESPPEDEDDTSSAWDIARDKN